MTIAHGGNIFEVARRLHLDWRSLTDFSANINPLGPAPGVHAAIVGALNRIVHYPEKEPVELKVILAKKWSVDPSQILLGNGATDLIYFLARVFRGTVACLHVPVFSEFHRAFADAGLVEGDDVNAWPTSGLLVITRPENPTGRMHDVADLTEWLMGTSNPVLIDESFIEFSGQPSLIRLIEQRPNLIILRSLTKFYALPGLRIGALVASRDFVRQWQEVREPWQVNVLASAAAIAALNDDEHALNSMIFVDGERDWLFHRLRTLQDVTAHRSHANFIYLQLRYPAAFLSDYLLERNILIRNCAGWPGVHGESVRVAVRTREENRILLGGWREFQWDDSVH